MSEAVGLVWDRGILRYDFGAQHPLKPVRVELTIELARAYGLLEHPRLRVVPGRVAARAELESVHAPEYVDAVERISVEAREALGDYGWGIGTADDPAFNGMHDASANVAGGSIAAAELVHTGAVEHAFHPSGGLHHAMRDHASGFCVYNDPAIAIRWLQAQGVDRIAYVDVDVHHGDGVQAAFYEDPSVLTISLHESGAYLFPGTGSARELGAGEAVGTSVNVALPPSTTHDAYLEAFDRVVLPVVEAFRPRILVTQLGCDTHATDPLAHLALETRTYKALAERFHALAHSGSDGRWLATGGGGYQIYSVVPRAWTIYFAEQLGAELRNEIPAEWAEIAADRGGSRLPVALYDEPLELPDAVRDRAREGARRSADETLAALAPYVSL